jgi:hypothetical protein
MNLKTRVRWAWAELGLAVLVGTGLAAREVVNAPEDAGIVGSAINALPWLLLCGLVAWGSWRRLRQCQAQCAELGPDASPSQDLWSAPRCGGLIGVALLVIALIVALAPALLVRP